MRSRSPLVAVTGTALAAAALGLTLVGSRSAAEAPPAKPPAPATTAPPSAPLVDVPALPEHAELAPADRALQVVAGKDHWVSAAEAQKAGFTLVDLGDAWAPFIFVDNVAPDGSALANRYRSVFLGLANDTGDEDGQPLGKGGHNYLEVYGIPPTLSVLRNRFVSDGAGACKDIDYAKIQAVKVLPVYEEKRQKKENQKLGELAAKIRKAQSPSPGKNAMTPDALQAAQDALAKADAQKVAFAEVEKRLVCEEGLYGKKAHHTPGRFDDAMRDAVTRFQLKNKLYDSTALRPDTMAALGRTPLENDYAALVRTLTERVVSAASILEDGSALAEDKHGTPDHKPTYVNAAGQRVPLRNLVDESITETLRQLGLATPEDGLAFFQRHQGAELSSLRAAVKLPPPPEYYSANMDLSVEIDRGDVIYDPPTDAKGKPCPYYRKHFPSFTLRLNYNNQRIPLVRWRTTIGGWRSEQASNGYEYYRYKGSDVGPRIWRHIVSAPVWIAPNSTPLRTLVKWKNVGKTSQQVVNYDELGPGYLSAYGLVVAYNVEPGRNGQPDGDNGVRVHGSSEYRSIRNPDGYSHGCHRLMNHLAERMFSFVLQHRHVVIEGDKLLGFQRQFLWKEDVFELRLPTRGYWYTLDPPMPVNVLQGNILGDVKKPITSYMPKPGVTYPPGPLPVPPDSPEARAGGGDE